jgi:hypothetical protein
MQALLSGEFRQIEFDSIEQHKARRLRACAGTSGVPALASMASIPLSAIDDIR